MTIVNAHRARPLRRARPTASRRSPAPASRCRRRASARRWPRPRVRSGEHLAARRRARQPRLPVQRPGVQRVRRLGRASTPAGRSPRRSHAERSLDGRRARRGDGQAAAAHGRRSRARWHMLAAAIRRCDELRDADRARQGARVRPRDPVRATRPTRAPAPVIPPTFLTKARSSRGSRGREPAGASSASTCAGSCTARRSTSSTGRRHVPARR